MPEHVPDVSIVTPSLNQGRYIEQTLCSVLQQEGVRLQYIVVDGVSNDQTLEILERYRSRIDVLLIEKDDGQADAIRKGLSLATGTICAYLNSDDYLLPGALSRVATFFSENPGIDAVYSDRIFVDGDDRLLRYWRLPMHSNYVMCRWDFIPQETCFWRRSAMEEAGGIDPSYGFAVDYDFFARMMTRGMRFKHISDFLAVFREHPDSKTSSALQTIGLAEMDRVRSRYGCRIRRAEYLVAAAYYGQLRLRSSLFQLLNPSGPASFRDRITTGR